MEKSINKLQDTTIDIKIQLSLIWTALLFCYIYCDYFDLYAPDKLKDMIALNSMLDSSWKLLAAAILMAVPSLMICLSVLLDAKINRILNIGVGVFFVLLLAMILFSLDLQWYKFYVLFALIEIVLAAIIVYKAYYWPKSNI